MKTTTIIRFVLSGIFATLGCVGMIGHVTGSMLFFSVAWLVLVGRAELTRPIPRSESWLMYLVLIGFFALILTLGYLRPPEPPGLVRMSISVVLWLGWMYAIYYRWKREKGKADA